jgi:NTP pyrophosphatase (non-canonical NTP hydrolase)
MKRPDLNPHHFDGKVSKVVEECGEVLHAIGKLQRHGAFATDPANSEIHFDNISPLKGELEDLQNAINRLLTEKIFALDTHISS